MDPIWLALLGVAGVWYALRSGASASSGNPPEIIDASTIGKPAAPADVPAVVVERPDPAGAIVIPPNTETAEPAASRLLAWTPATLMLRVRPSGVAPKLYRFNGEYVLLTEHWVTQNNGEILDNYSGFIDVPQAHFRTFAVASELAAVVAGTSSQCSIYIAAAAEMPAIFALYYYLRDHRALDQKSAQMPDLQICAIE